MLIHVLLLLVLGCAGAAREVTVGGIFEVCSSDNQTDYEQSQYLATFLMAVREINNKSDGVLDDLLPNTTLRVIVRPVCNSIDVAQAGVNMIEKDSVDGTIGVDAVVSTMESSSKSDVFLSEVLHASQTLHILTREMHPDTHLNVFTHYPYGVNISPDAVLQMRVWQSILCQYGYTTVSLFYVDSIFGLESLAVLADGYYCPITLASSHAIAPGQTHFGEEVQEAFDTLSIVQMIILDMDTAVPFLVQACRYGLIRQNHQLILNSELLTDKLWERLKDNGVLVEDVLRGALGVKYSPTYGLAKTEAGLSFQERFRNQPNTLIDGVCDASLDDSDGTHYLYRNADGSRCAGLNHSSFLSASDFAPKVGLVYDGVVALAMGLHKVIYNHSSAVTSSALVDVLERVAFTGVSGAFSVGKDMVRHSCGLVRHTGYYYDIIGFHAESYWRTGAGFVYVGSWDDMNFARPCFMDEICTRHVYNTPTGALPSHHPRYVNHELPEVLKIGIFIDTFTKDGSVNAAGVQHLAAFLMAVREINNKTDGIADDLLRNTTIVLAVRGADGLFEAHTEAVKLAYEDFGSGVDVIISAKSVYYSLITYHLQTTRPVLVSHSVESHLLLDNSLLTPLKLQMSHSPSMYGMALQSIVCEKFGYTKVGVFVSKKLHYLQAYSEFIRMTYCAFDILSYCEIDDVDDIDAHVRAAKSSGARVFVLFTDAGDNEVLIHRGTKLGLFGQDRQVFVHADDVSNDLFGDDGDELLHGFVVIKESPNGALEQTPEGRDFVRRWREQRHTIGSLMNGTQRCLNDRDDNDHAYLYRSPPKLNSTPVCSGLEFSEFSSSGSDIESYVPQSYDAVMMFARGYHKVIYDYHMPVVDPYSVYGTILTGVQFEGASGRLDLDDGSIVSSKRGTRRSGLYYDVYNYVRGGIHDILEPPGKYLIGTWEATQGFVVCNQTSAGCKPAFFNSYNGEPVLQSPPPSSLDLTMGTVVGLKVMAVALGFHASVFLLLYVFRRHYDVIGQAYCGMLPVMCLGAYFMAMRLWLTTVPVTDDVCSLRIIGLYTCFIMFWGPVAMSSVRAYRLKWESSRVTKYNVSNIQLAQLFLTVGVMGYCAVVGFGLRGYVRLEYAVTSNNRTETSAYCGYTTKIYSTILMFVQMSLLACGLRCAYKARNIIDRMGETKVSYGILLMFFLYLLTAYPMWLMLDLTPADNIILVEYNVAGLHVLALVILIFHKLHILQKVGEDKKSIACVAYYNPDSDEQYSSAASSAASVQNLMNAMTHDSKVKLCRRQVNEWMALLMSIDFSLRNLPVAVNGASDSVPDISLATNGLPVLSWTNTHSPKRTTMSCNQQLTLEDIPEVNTER